MNFWLPLRTAREICVVVVSLTVHVSGTYESIHDCLLFKERNNRARAMQTTVTAHYLGEWLPRRLISKTAATTTLQRLRQQLTATTLTATALPKGIASYFAGLVKHLIS